MRKEDDALIALLSTEINRRQDELINLEATFKLLGGTFDGDEETERPAKQKLLSGPKQKKQRRKKSKKVKAAEPDEFGVTIDGQFVKLRERQAAVVELLMAAAGQPVGKAAINEAWGSPLNFAATFSSINKRLADISLVAAPVRGEGYQLRKI